MRPHLSEAEDSDLILEYRGLEFIHIWEASDDYDDDDDDNHDDDDDADAEEEADDDDEDNKERLTQFSKLV